MSLHSLESNHNTGDAHIVRRPILVQVSCVTFHVELSKQTELG